MSAAEDGLREMLARYAEGLTTNNNPGGRARAQVQRDLRAATTEGGA